MSTMVMIIVHSTEESIIFADMEEALLLKIYAKRLKGALALHRVAVDH